MSTFTAGNLIRCTAAFTASNTPIDPTSVGFAWKVGSTGVPTRYVYGVGGQIVRDGTGLYHVDLDTTDLPGNWIVVYASGGVGEASGTISFTVTALPIPIAL